MSSFAVGTIIGLMVITMAIVDAYLRRDIDIKERAHYERLRYHERIIEQFERMNNRRDEETS